MDRARLAAAGLAVPQQDRLQVPQAELVADAQAKAEMVVA